METLGTSGMFRFQMRLIIALSTFILFSSSAHAQFNGDLGQLGQDSETTGGTDSGTGTNSGLDADEAFSDLQRGNSFGATENTGRGFSDSSVAPPTNNGAAGAGSVTPAGIGGGIGGFGGVGGFGRLFDSMNTGTAESTSPIIRTRLRSAVQVRPRAPMQIQQIAASRFQSIPSRPELSRINVTMQGRTAVLQGSVGSESDRRMSQLLMRLEPGVSRVDNRVIVQP